MFRGHLYYIDDINTFHEKVTSNDTYVKRYYYSSQKILKIPFQDLSSHENYFASLYFKSYLGINERL